VRLPTQRAIGYHAGVRAHLGVLVLATISCTSRSRAASGDEIPVRVVTVAEGLLQPVSLAFTPEGDLFVSEKQTGNVRLVRRATSDKPAAPETAATLGPVDPRSERGLLGLATHPRWSQGKRLLYAYYTTAERPAVQRVVALEMDERLRAKGAPRVILDGLPAAPPGGLNHDGGVITLREEGGRTLLYVFCGDNALGQREPIWPHPSQEVSWVDAETGKPDTTPLAAAGDCPARHYSLHGKILRVRDDGGMPGDNPTVVGAGGDRAQGRCSPIFALGLRNGYGMGFHPHTGDLWVTDNGNERDEEVHRIVAGGNYGWPCMHGRTPNTDDGDFWGTSRGACAKLRGAFSPPEYIDPGRPGADNTPGYAGLAFISRCQAYGPSYLGNLVWASSDGRLFRARPRPPAYREFLGVDTSWVTLRFPVDVETGPDGLLYVADLSGSVHRIVPARPVPPGGCLAAPAQQ